jgi:MtN3 and saliva related transmembrane protein
MQITNVLGGIAAVCSTISFVPQAWKIIKTRDTKDISTGMYVLTVGGFFLWTAYGISLKQWPLVASNAICFLLSAFILMMKLSTNAKNKVARAVATKKKGRRNH